MYLSIYATELLCSGGVGQVSKESKGRRGLIKRLRDEKSVFWPVDLCVLLFFGRLFTTYVPTN